ncbi:hypothetical protein B0T13DRAFT_313465 [Neurospora crassa]|nr:hypothetical protein B0T13DRAFT_313465 [Neurospora crassa]
MRLVAPLFAWLAILFLVVQQTCATARSINQSICHPCQSRLVTWVAYGHEHGRGIPSLSEAMDIFSAFPSSLTCYLELPLCHACDPSFFQSWRYLSAKAFVPFAYRATAKGQTHLKLSHVCYT